MCEYWIKDMMPRDVLNIVFYTVLGGSIGIRCFMHLRDFAIEGRQAFVSVNEDEMVYWDAGKIQSIPMSEILGAIVFKDESSESLRLYRTADTESGFEMIRLEFKRYAPRSGPVLAATEDIKDCNTLVRLALIHHFTARRDQDMPSAAVPPFVIQSVKKKKRWIVAGESKIDRVFLCDGETITYADEGQKTLVPVSAILSTNEWHHYVGDLMDGHTITLILDESCGIPDLQINLMNLPHADHIVEYCGCMSALFERPASP